MADRKKYRYSGVLRNDHTDGSGNLQSINPEISGIMFPTAYNAVNSKEWVESRNK